MCLTYWVAQDHFEARKRAMNTHNANIELKELGSVSNPGCSDVEDEEKSNDHKAVL